MVAEAVFDWALWWYGELLGRSRPGERVEQTGRQCGVPRRPLFIKFALIFSVALFHLWGLDHVSYRLYNPFTVRHRLYQSEFGEENPLV